MQTAPKCVLDGYLSRVGLVELGLCNWFVVFFHVSSCAVMCKPSIDTNVHTLRMKILLTCAKKYRWTYLQIAIWEKPGKIASATVSRAQDEDERDFGASGCIVTSPALRVILSRWKDAEIATLFYRLVQHNIVKQITEEECWTRTEPIRSDLHFLNSAMELEFLEFWKGTQTW